MAKRTRYCPNCRSGIYPGYAWCPECNALRPEFEPFVHLIVQDRGTCCDLGANARTDLRLHDGRHLWADRFLDFVDTGWVPPPEAWIDSHPGGDESTDDGATSSVAVDTFVDPAWPARVQKMAGKTAGRVHMSRVLTVMFTDIKGFTERTSTRSRTDLRRLLTTHEDLMRPLFDQCAGHVVKTIGDAFMVVFDSPTNAVICGMLIQDTLRKYNETAMPADKLHVRVAINTGECEISKADVYGEAVNIAARIEAITEADEIYFTESVYLNMQKSEVPTAEVGKRTLKGIPFEVKVYRVLHDTKDERWAELLERARSGQLKTSSPDFSAAFKAGKTPISAWVPLIALVTLVLLVLFAGVMISVNGLQNGGQPDKDKISHSVEEARSLAASGKTAEALELLNRVDEETSRSSQLLDSEILSMLRKRVTELAADGQLDKVDELTRTWSERRPRMGTMFKQEYQTAVNMWHAELVKTAKAQLDARLDPGDSEAAQREFDRVYEGHMAALRQFLADYPHTAEACEAAVVDLTRAETDRLVEQARFDRALEVLANREEERTTYAIRLAAKRESVVEKSRVYAVAEAVRQAGELIASDMPEEAVVLLGEELRENDAPGLRDAMVRAIRANAEKLLRMRKYELARKSYDDMLRLYPELTSDLRPHHEDLVRRLRVIEGIESVRALSEEGEHESAIKAGRTMVTTNEQSAEALSAYKEALASAIEYFCTSGLFLKAIVVLDEEYQEMARFLEPEDNPEVSRHEQEVKKVLRRAAREMPPSSRGQANHVWNVVRDRYPDDVELVEAAVVYWSKLGPSEAFPWVRMLSKIPGTDARMRSEPVMEVILHAATTARRDSDFERTVPLLKLLPQDRVVAALTDVVTATEGNRQPAFDYLKEIGSVTPQLEFIHQWRNWAEKGASANARDARTGAASYFRQLKADGKLEALKEELADQISFDFLHPLDDNTGATLELSIEVLRECFLEEAKATLLKEVTGMKSVNYRRACFLVLKGTPLIEEVDVFAYHKKNMFEYEYQIFQYPFLREATTYFASLKGSEKEAEAKAQLLQGSKHLEDVWEYSKNDRASIATYPTVRKWFDEALAVYGLDRNDHD